MKALDKRTLRRTLDDVKAIPVTELRQRTAEVLEDLHTSEEPYVILQRSQKAAYLVDADQYDAQMSELRAARRQLFLREVREAEAELASGTGSKYDDIDDLIRALDRKTPK
jgi:prevent-host-death family protein